MKQNNPTNLSYYTNNSAGSDYLLAPISLQNAHGSLTYGMTNDYMFRAVLQSNNKALKGLICALLHLTETEVVSVKVTNPIILGSSLAGKECRLDIHVLLNDRTRINLEMQVTNKLNWKERSVIYLCRTFDQIKHGQDYAEIKPAVHIGFLDYTLFEDCPKFYATYKLSEIENQKIYSDNFTLSVVDLTQVDLATEDDKKYHIHFWAELFKATTWEEIKMLASKDEYLNEAANSIFQFNTDEQIRKLCRDREEYYQDLRNYDMNIAEREAIIAKQDALIAEKDASIAERDASIAEKDASIAEKDASIAERDAFIAEKDAFIAEKDASIAEKDAEIQRLLAEIAKLRGN